MNRGQWNHVVGSNDDTKVSKMKSLILLRLYLLTTSLFAYFPMAQAQLSTPPSVSSSNSDVKRPSRLTYVPAQMIERLVRLAEGSIPTQIELEKEFSFEFQLRRADKDESEYWGQAPRPFAQGRPRNVSYYEFGSRQAITLNYIDDSEYCISTVDLINSLSNKWKRHVLPHGHFPTRVFYVITIGDISRQLELDPNYMHGDSCLKLFSVDYHAIQSLKEGKK